MHGDDFYRRLVRQVRDYAIFGLDPDGRIIAALLENPTVGLDHVRMMAFHHRTGTGLELITRRQDWLRDLQVERRLLRNPQTPETVLTRVMSPKQLLQTYKIMVDREIPELTRTRVRGHFRKKWMKNHVILAVEYDNAVLIFRKQFAKSFSALNSSETAAENNYRRFRHVSQTPMPPLLGVRIFRAAQ